MSVQIDEIRKVAKLAKLSIDESQVSNVCDGFNQILGLVDKMQQCDTDNIKPLANPHDAKQRLRVDEVTATNERDKLMQVAPETENGLFLVPKVID